MDVADWLQALPTKDGKEFLVDKEAASFTSEEFSQKFYESELGKSILKKLDSELEGLQDENEALKEWMKQTYRNDWYGSLKLLVQREMLLWWRDKTPLYARIGQGKQIRLHGMQSPRMSPYVFVRSCNGACCRDIVLARK